MKGEVTVKQPVSRLHPDSCHPIRIVCPASRRSVTTRGVPPPRQSLRLPVSPTLDMVVEAVQVHRVGDTGGVDPSPPHRIALRVVQALGVRPGSPVDYHHVLGRARHGEARVAGTEPDADHEHPVVGRGVRRIDDQPSGELTLEPLPVDAAAGGRRPVVVPGTSARNRNSRVAPPPILTPVSPDVGWLVSPYTVRVESENGLRSLTRTSVPCGTRISGPGTCGGLPTSAKASAGTPGPPSPSGCNSPSRTSSARVRTPRSIRPAGAGCRSPRWPPAPAEEGRKAGGTTARVRP